MSSFQETPDGNAVVYCEGAYRTPNGKTAHGLVRFTRRYRVAAVIDSTSAWENAGEVLGIGPSGLPIVSDLNEALAVARDRQLSVTHFVIGLAPDGGRLPDKARLDVMDALGRGLHVDSGLHDYLSDGPELAALARARGCRIRDVRKPPPIRDPHFFSGKIDQVKALRIAVLGTDSAIGAIAWEQKTAAEARAAGRRVDLIPEQGLWSEWILEIEPLPPNDARIVWEWHLWDHLVQNFDPDAANHGDPARYPRRLDINGDGDAVEIDEEELEQLKALGYVPDNATSEDVRSDFLHMNAIDYHPRLDQIAVSVPFVDEIWILDHSTTTEEARGSSGGRSGRGGELLYRWGNPKVYGRGVEADEQLFGQHNVLWIPDGWKNAGHLTVFNNGGGRPDGDWSSVIEIAPPVDDDGNYPLAEGEAFGPRAPVWAYEAKDRKSFHAPFVSGAQRLTNGNTFICAGPLGRYFEVGPEGAIVWEYRNPFHGDVPGWNPPGVDQLPYGSFRVTKIPPDHPGLAGRALVPLDPEPPANVPPPATAAKGEP